MTIKVHGTNYIPVDRSWLILIYWFMI